MSSGDIDNIHYSDEKLAEFRRMHPIVNVYLEQTFVINQDFDIPFLGGISVNWRPVYLDRHFDRYQYVDGRTIDLGEFIGVHETVELFCVTELGMSYTQAHRWSNTFEDLKVRARGINPQDYNRAIDRFVPKIEHEKITITPRDLAMYPYTEQPALFSAIKAAMR